MIEVSGLAKGFGDSPVLGRVSFSVEAGSAYVVLGASGSGKSVLLKCLAGLLTPDRGHVTIASSNVGMLFQNNALFDSLTVEDNLLFPLAERLGITGSAARERASALLDAVGLTGTEALMPASLSGGMQKRLGIARALIVEPQVLLYDEPTAGLDPITSRMIAELIVSLRKARGTTIVAVTSDVMRAFQLADRIGLLVRTAEGSDLIDIGTPEDARASSSPAVRQFIHGLQEGPLTAALNEPTHQPHAAHLTELEHDPF